MGDCNKRRLTGFSLLEVLIALTVFSIGLLGLASLQGLSVMSSNRAHLQSQAVLVAQEMIDRMRANREQLVAGTYEITSEEFPVNASDCANTCTPVQLAQFDLAQWKCSLGQYDSQTFCQSEGISGVLPNGDGQVEMNQNQVMVIVFWDNGSGKRRSIELAMQL